MTAELANLSATVEGLMDAVASLKEDAPNQEALQKIIQRGKFRPAENEAIGFWLARFLTIRNGLWPVIDSVLANLDGRPKKSTIPTDEELRFFVVGYAAVCLLIGIDRLMLFDVGSSQHHTAQAKRTLSRASNSSQAIHQPIRSVRE